MQLQTVNGNLKKFRKYYQTFIEYNSGEDLSYLGYPFDNDIHSIEVITAHDKFLSVLKSSSISNDKDLRKWTYDWVVCAFKNKTHHRLAATILFVQIYHIGLSGHPYHVLDNLEQKIKANKAEFNKLLFEENAQNWIPNS